MLNRLIFKNIIYLNQIIFILIRSSIKFFDVFLGLAILIWLEMVNPNLDLLLPYQNEILELVNDQRSKGCRCGQDSIPPRPPLQWNNRIAKAAIEHAKYMHRSGLLTHTDGKGQRADVRLKRQGIIGKHLLKMSVEDTIHL